MWNLPSICFGLAFASGTASTAASPTYSPTEQEQRPQYHFLPESNWMNDPNAPFYDTATGLHHLFYQYLTPRTWGHAISTNLVDWTILPMALNYSDSPYTEMPASTAGVYSGSALLMTLASGAVVPWLSVSVPTNDMQLLAYPADLSDPHFTEWVYSSGNPIIFSPDPSADTPPGRDPTEVWPCGLSGQNKWCLSYATQTSDGCPCSGVSGTIIYSAIFDDADGAVGSWSSWTREGYLLNDTATGADAAVMWECTDLFPVVPAEDIWMLKFSIGPGPSSSKPWGRPGSRDYYVTGVYRPLESASVPASEVSTTQFTPSAEQFAAAMARDEGMALDPGAFYASKSFTVPEVGRVLIGWLPEERPVDEHGNPFGWAGAMSLPRLLVPFQVPGSDDYYVRTPLLESALESLREGQQQVYPASTLQGTFSEPSALPLPRSTGAQLEITVAIGHRGMHSGDACGVRLRSSASEAGQPDSMAEYTDVWVQFWNCSTPVGGEESACGSVTLSVDTSHSNSNMSQIVNRSECTSGTVALSDLLQEVRGDSVQMRAILDHSVLESFLGSGGERAVTRRVYPSAPEVAVNSQLIARCGTLADCSCAFLEAGSWSLRSSSSTLATNDSGGSDSDSYIVYIIVPVVTALLVFFFLYRHLRRNRSNKDAGEKLLGDE